MGDLTDFQVSCEQRLREVLSRHGKEFADKQITRGRTAGYIQGKISGTDIYVFIYEDGAEFGRELLDCRYESPGFDNGEELIDALVKDLATELERGPYPIYEESRSSAPTWFGRWLGRVLSPRRR